MPAKVRDDPHERLNECYCYCYCYGYCYCHDDGDDDDGCYYYAP